MVKGGMSIVMNDRPLTLKEQVELLLPAWQSWYPSLFDAAADLGLIRARVCAPSSLMLSNRHAAIQAEAVQAFKEQWSVEDEPPETPEANFRYRRPLSKKGGHPARRPVQGKRR
jgi:hypothetical protein